ncbi:HEAT repeat domain-containing protein [Natrialbaceae archaeon A-chndr2]
MTSDEQSAIKELQKRAQSRPEEVPIGPVVAALEEGDDAERDRAMTVLYVISNDAPERVVEAVPSLEPLFESDRPMVRTKVALVLENIGSTHPEKLTSHAEPIIELLDDQSITVRQSAISVIRQIAAESPTTIVAAVPKVIALLDSDIESARLDAVIVLRLIAAADSSEVLEALGPLLAVLDTHYGFPDDITYDPAMSTDRSVPSAQMRGYRTLTADKEGRSANVRAREEAAFTVAKVIENDPETATEHLEEHLPGLYSHLDDPNPTIRSSVVGILAHIAGQSPEAIEPVETELVELLTDHLAVSAGAVWALRYGGSERGHSALQELAADPEVEPVLRRTATEALAELDS